MSALPRQLLKIRYYEAAQEYLRNLPLRHFMESTPQATQRAITLASFALVHARRPEVQLFNELLLQYPVGKRKKPGQVVPDNMVVVHAEPIDAVGSYDLPLQPVLPLVVMEYVSAGNRRKDYVDSMTKYEHELKIPYYLLFAPDQQEMTLFHHDGRRYQTVLPDAHGRTAIPDLELEVGILDNWVRYWFQAKLLPLPGELQTSVDGLTKELRQAKRRVGKEHKERIAAEQRAVQEQQQRLAAEQKALDAEQKALDAEQKALDAEQKARQNLQQLQAAEEENTKLRALLGNLPRPPENP